MEYYFADKLFSQLSKITFLLESILKENKHMSAQMDLLIEAVTAENTVIDSAVTMLSGLNAQLKTITDQLTVVTQQLAEANVNTVELQKVNDAAVALQAEVTAKTEALTAAMLANTPV